MAQNSLGQSIFDAQKEVTDVNGKFNARGVFQSSMRIHAVSDAITPHHQNSINDTLRLLARFHLDDQADFQTLLSIAKEELEKFTNRLIHIAKQGANNLGSDFSTIDSQFNNRLNNALNDIGCGFVGGQNLRKSPGGSRRLAFELLKEIYNALESDFRASIDIKKCAEAIGYSESEWKSAESYLAISELIKNETFGGDVSITPKGIGEIENAFSQPDRATEYFPPIMHVNIARDTYQFGQAGAVGPGARSYDTNLEQNATNPNVDASQLVKELGLLRTALREANSGTAQEDEAVGLVAKAESSASIGEVATAVHHLRVWTQSQPEHV